MKTSSETPTAAYGTPLAVESCVPLELLFIESFRIATWSMKAAVSS
jgi:hypothetical protein